jgi:outer membrane immunogenic protein
VWPKCHGIRRNIGLFLIQLRVWESQAREGSVSMKKFLLAALAASALLGGSAMAADLAIMAPVPVPVPVWSWSGFYIGLNGGYSTGADDFTQTVFDPGLSTTGFNFTNNTINPRGGLFGGQVGFNWQTGPVVWGVEGDWQWASQSATACGQACLVETIAGFGTAAITGNTVYQKLKWFGTARGRVGWANNGYLFYITAGGAWAGIDETDAVTTFIGPPFVATPVSASQAASFSNRISGVAYGAGIEVLLWAGLTGKLEYLHMDLGGTTNTFTLVPPILTLGGPITTATSRIRDDIFRVGVNWKFWGGPAIMAAY